MLHSSCCINIRREILSPAGRPKSAASLEPGLYVANLHLFSRAFRCLRVLATQNTAGRPILEMTSLFDRSARALSVQLLIGTSRSVCDLSSTVRGGWTNRTTTISLKGAPPTPHYGHLLVPGTVTKKVLYSSAHATHTRHTIPATMADTVKDAVEGVVDAVKNATIGESSSSAAGGTAPNLVKDEETGEMVSKTELKKRVKARELAAKKAAKAAAAPKPAAAANKKADKVDMSDLNPNQYFELRSRQIKHLLDTKSPNPYPHKFHTELDPRTFVEKYQHLKRGEYDQSTQLRLGARIMSKREFGNKLRFYVTQAEGVTIQVVAQADYSADPENYIAEHEHLQRGDIIGIVGFPGSMLPLPHASCLLHDPKG